MERILRCEVMAVSCVRCTRRRRLKGCGNPAVDEEDLAGDIAGVIGAEEEGWPGDIFWITGSAQGDAAIFQVDVLEPVRVVLVSRAVRQQRHARVDEAGRKGVDDDSVGRDVAGERPREVDDGSL